MAKLQDVPDMDEHSTGVDTMRVPQGKTPVPAVRNASSTVCGRAAINAGITPNPDLTPARAPGRQLRSALSDHCRPLSTRSAVPLQPLSERPARVVLGVA